MGVIPWPAPSQCACLFVVGVFGHQTQTVPSSMFHGLGSASILDDPSDYRVRKWDSRPYIAINFNRPVAVPGVRGSMLITFCKEHICTPYQSATCGHGKKKEYSV